MKKSLFCFFLVFLIFSGNAMAADVKVSALPAMTTPTDDDLLMIIDGSTSKKITWANVKASLPSTGGLTASEGAASALPGTCTSPATYFATDTKNYYFCTAANEWLIAFGKGSDGTYGLTMLPNTTRAPTASAYELYVDGVLWKFNQNGTEYTAVIGPTAGQVSIVGPSAARVWTAPDAAISIARIDAAQTLTGTQTMATDVVLTSATAGVRLTGGNGLLTIKGEGDGTDEDLTVNLNSANTATVSSSTSVDTINFSAINLLTTGAIHGAVEVIGDDTSLSAAQCYGSINDTNGTETITLPAAVVGMNVLIYSNDATVKTVDPNSSEVIELNGVALTGGYAIKSPGAAGNFVALWCRTAGVWTTMGMSGVWVTNGS